MCAPRLGAIVWTIIGTIIGTIVWTIIWTDLGAAFEISPTLDYNVKTQAPCAT